MSYKDIFWQSFFEENSLPCVFFSKDLIVQHSNMPAKKAWDVIDLQTNIEDILFPKITENLKKYIRTNNQDAFHFEIKCYSQMLLTTVSSCGDGYILMCFIQQPLSHSNHRLVQLGQLTGDMFHSLSNPLAVIQGRVELMMMVVK